MSMTTTTMMMMMMRLALAGLAVGVRPTTARPSAAMAYVNASDIAENPQIYNNPHRFEQQRLSLLAVAPSQPLPLVPLTNVFITTAPNDYYYYYYYSSSSNNNKRQQPAVNTGYNYDGKHILQPYRVRGLRWLRKTKNNRRRSNSKNSNEGETKWSGRSRRKRQTLDGLGSAEHRLFRHLFAKNRYRRTVRPKINHNERLKVNVGICVMSVDEILEQDPMVTTGCIKFKWTDDYLSWDPSLFGNLTAIVLPSSKIWLPDIALINSAEPYVTDRTAFVEVSNDGAVGFYPSGRFATKCKISLTFFPFDRQVCEMQFESWTYPIEWIELILWPEEPVDVKEFYRNHQWDLDRVDAVSGKAFYDDFEFSTMRFVFHIRRRTLHYVTLYVFPCALISAMQILSHSLPVEHPARVTLLTGIFVAQSVIQSSLTEQTPKSSDGISLTQLYIEIFTACMLFSMIVTFINMHVWFRSSSSPLLAARTFPSLGVLMQSFFFCDVQSYYSDDVASRYYVTSKRPGAQVTTTTTTTTTTQPSGSQQRQSSVSPSPDLFAPIQAAPVPLKQPASSRSHHHQRRRLSSLVTGPGPAGARRRRLGSWAQRSGATVTSDNNNNNFAATRRRQTMPSTSAVKAAATGTGRQGSLRVSRSTSEQSMGLAGTAASPPSVPLPPLSSWQGLTAEERSKKNWIKFCLMLDKVCMYVFALAGLVSPLAIFVVVPHAYNVYLESFDKDAHNATNYFYTIENVKIHYFHEFQA